ncbi:MAG: rRNA maturation RNase YbeY [Caulobacteraceae bacterium]|nr:MAG: rRNA maturation RNase YbeY [Caulobacteraceae bacterium]
MGDPASPEIEVEIEDPAWNAVQDVAAVVTRAARAAGPAGGVVILLTDDEAVAELNQQFRQKAGPTNVLSFPAPQNPENLLGDIALAYGVCAREAVEQGKSLADHLSHLTVHGVLHLAGYDHGNDDEAQVMEDLERRVLATLGVSDPYAS